MKMIREEKPKRGYHFICANHTTGKHNLAVSVGDVRHAEGKIVLCENGLHWCKTAFDALEYAPGPVLCEVEAWGETVSDATKSVSSYRRCLSIRDVSAELEEFACLCAERGLRRERKAGREPDPASWNVIDAKRMWLEGHITDDELRAAWAAATPAAEAAWADAAPAAAWAARAADRRWQKRTFRKLLSPRPAKGIDGGG